MAQNDSSAVEKLMFLLIGAGIGATVALLFAPKSGSELRGDIADATRKGLDAASQGARRAGEKASELYDSSRERLGDAYESARERVLKGAGSVGDVAGRQKEQIAAAIEAGKQAYREEKRKVGDSVRAAVEGETS